MVESGVEYKDRTLIQSVVYLNHFMVCHTFFI
jgi:hypothetical protein